MNRGNRILLACAYWAFVLYVFVPLLLMVLMGFKDSRFIGFPIRSWTLDWYLGVFADADVLFTFGYSIAIAVLSTLISVIVGVWLAVLLEGRKFVGRAAVYAMMILPALVPGVISAIAFRIYARLLGHRARHGRHRLGARRAQRALRDAGGDGAALHAAEKPDRGRPRSRRRPGRRLPADHAALSDAGDPWRVDLLPPAQLRRFRPVLLPRRL
jgi:hypothetical protein